MKGQVLQGFEEAKKIAFEVSKGCYRRAHGTNYCGFQSIDGSKWVLGDSENDIDNPDTIIGDKPAVQVFKNV